MARLSKIFDTDSPYKKQARATAIVWTLLIFIACLWPGKELPHSDIPLIDKWVHFALFAPFVFLWLCANPPRSTRQYFILFLTGAATGFLVEILQYIFAFLGRSYDNMDILADAIGALLGALLFAGCRRLSRK